MRKWTYAIGLPIFAIMLALLGFILYREFDSAPTPASGRTTWVWSLEELLNDNGGAEEVIRFLEEQKVNAVYLHVDDTLKKAAAREAYRDFIRQASMAGIQVHALGGDRDWVLEPGREEFRVFLELITDYNGSAPAESRFTGVHLDVEPYLLKEWEEDRRGVVASWREMTEEFVSFAQAHSLETGMDLPFWLDTVPAGDDNENDGIRTLDQWMMARSDSVSLMSYRNEAEGEDGVLAIVAGELEHAGRTGGTVYVGLNAAKDEEEKLTFYDRAAEELRRMMRRIDDEYAGQAGYGGIAVHDLASWMRKERE